MCKHYRIKNVKNSIAESAAKDIIPPCRCPNQEMQTWFWLCLGACMWYNLIMPGYPCCSQGGHPCANKDITVQI